MIDVNNNFNSINIEKKIESIQIQLLSKNGQIKEQEEYINSLLEEKREMQVIIGQLKNLKYELAKQKDYYTNYHDTQNGILFPWIAPNSFKIIRNIRGFFYVFSLYGGKTALSCKFTSRTHKIPKVDNISLHYKKNSVKASKIRIFLNKGLFFYSVNGFKKTLLKMWNVIKK